MPDSVPIPVLSGYIVGEHFHSNAVWVELETIAVTFVVKRGEYYGQIIIAPELRALPERVGINILGLRIDQPSPDVQRIVVVVDADSHRLAWLRVFDGHNLMKIVD